MGVDMVGAVKEAGSCSDGACRIIDLFVRLNDNYKDSWVYCMNSK